MYTSNNSPGHGGSPLFLIGFMGSGKSYWGNFWSQQYSLPFYDLDAAIEKQEQKTIAQIFEQHGETYFRNEETAVLKQFTGKQNCIVACGGGTPCFNNNIKWMNANGTTVYLKATPKQIYNRVINEQHKRPVIKHIPQAELLSFIEKKLYERENFYAQAKYVFPVAELTAKTLTPILQTHT